MEFCGTSFIHQSYVPLYCSRFYPTAGLLTFMYVASFNDRHTGEHIGAMIKKCLYSWSLTDKVHLVVRDNGTNFVAGLRGACRYS